MNKITYGLCDNQTFYKILEIIYSKNNNIIIDGSVALYLSGFVLHKFPEDLDILILENDSSKLIDQFKDYNSKYNSYGEVTCEILGIKVDFIKISLEEYDKRNSTYSYIFINENKNIRIPFSNAYYILHTKLDCCFKSIEHKQNHIEQLNYYLINNINRLHYDP